MNNKKGALKSSIKSVIVLSVIVLVSSTLLAVTNEVTNPIIIENEKRASLEARQLLLPEAVEFEEVDYTANETVRSVAVDKGGNGIIVVVSDKGYGGDVAVTIAVDSDGKIIGMSVDASTETVGLGTEVALPEYTDRFLGKDSSSEKVNTISGATYSSKVVVEAANTAFEIFDWVKGGMK
ncbi:MAG: FMN-binding protein [Ruminococcaceae bacterium]|nr:FMN-binding protein [Oscillospiraceae bacterium]